VNTIIATLDPGSFGWGLAVGYVIGAVAMCVGLVLGRKR
jgi:hypothetical protein